MTARWIRLALIVSVLSSMGTHLVILQTVAWTKMAMSFSQKGSLKISLQKTFDGRHPCALCLKIKKASRDNNSLRTSRIENRVDLLYPQLIFRPFKIEALWALVPFAMPSCSIFLATDSPPPRKISA